MKKSILNYIIVFVLTITSLFVPTFNVYGTTYTYERDHNLLVDINPYSKSDIYALMDLVSTGQLTKPQVVYRLMNRCETNFVYFKTGEINIECYNGYDLVYTIGTNAECEFVAVYFTEGLYNGKDFTSISIDDVMGSEKSRYIKKKMQYIVVDEPKEVEYDPTIKVIASSKFELAAVNSGKNTDKCKQLWLYIY